MNEDDFKQVILHPKKEQTVNSVTQKSPHKNDTINTVKKVVNDDGEVDILPVMINKKFGQQIQQSRMLKKITQKQLAQAVGLPLDIINKYEKGEAVRNGVYVSKIKKYLEIDKNS